MAGPLRVRMGYFFPSTKTEPQADTPPETQHTQKDRGVDGDFFLYNSQMMPAKKAIPMASFTRARCLLFLHADVLAPKKSARPTPVYSSFFLLLCTSTRRFFVAQRGKQKGCA